MLVRPSRLAVVGEAPLEPVGLITSPTFLGFTVAHGYEGLLGMLAGFGSVDRGDPAAPVPGADVVAVPYDFRVGIEAAAERLDRVVSARLDGLSEGERAARVIVVGHSMGGLVARYWMGPMGRWPWCRALITLGTPHRGAPKALDWLVNGPRAAGVPLPGVRPVLRSWRSLPQLLPAYPAVRATAVPDPRADGAVLYPHELPVEWLREPAGVAYRLHRQIEAAWGRIPGRGPEVVPCLGWSHPTPDAAFWDGGRLRVDKTPPTWLGLAGWEKDYGDGTVPAPSALPPEMDNYARAPVRVELRHGPIAAAPVVMELLQRYEVRRPPRMLHGSVGGEHPPAIGLDLEEIHLAAQPVPLTVIVREVDADISGTAVWATLEPVGDTHAEGGQVSAEVRLEWDTTTGSFRGALAGQPPGLYRVRVDSHEVPEAGHLAAADTVAVIEDA
jgi:hypothetical protein